MGLIFQCRQGLSQDSVVLAAVRIFPKLAGVSKERCMPLSWASSIRRRAKLQLLPHGDPEMTMGFHVAVILQADGAFERIVA